MPTETDLRSASAALVRFLDADRRFAAATDNLNRLTDSDPGHSEAEGQHGLTLLERSAAQAHLFQTAVALGASDEVPFALARDGKIAVFGECFGCQSETWTIVDTSRLFDLSGVESVDPLDILAPCNSPA